MQLLVAGYVLKTARTQVQWASFPDTITWASLSSRILALDDTEASGPGTFRSTKIFKSPTTLDIDAKAGSKEGVGASLIFVVVPALSLAETGVAVFKLQDHLESVTKIWCRSSSLPRHFTPKTLPAM